MEEHLPSKQDMPVRFGYEALGMTSCWHERKASSEVAGHESTWPVSLVIRIALYHAAREGPGHVTVKLRKSWPSDLWCQVLPGAQEHAPQALR
jgi:hypothetical protein